MHRTTIPSAIVLLAACSVSPPTLPEGSTESASTQAGDDGGATQGDGDGATPGDGDGDGDDDDGGDASAGDDGPTGGDDVATGAGDTASGGDATAGDGDSTGGLSLCDSVTPSKVGDCDAYAQDCPAGERCVPYSAAGGSAWDSTTCMPIDPAPAQLGEPCTFDPGLMSGDSCDLGLMCWYLDVGSVSGECIALCECGPRDPVCPVPDATCEIGNGGVLPLCLSHCDPIDPGACPPEHVCVPSQSDDSPYFVCLQDASGAEGAVLDACEFANTCDVGLQCIASADVPGCVHPVGCCTPNCDLDAPDCSAVPNAECRPWYEGGAEPPGYDHVGICLVPAG